jgi:hypothetical protein
MAVNSLAVPVVMYSFNIINWKQTELAKMDVKTRKLMTMHHMHHPKADVIRIYLPRAEGGRGLQQLENGYKIATIGLKCYLENTNELMLKCVNQHDKAKKLYSINKHDDKFRKEIQLEFDKKVVSDAPTEQAKSIKAQAKKISAATVKTEAGAKTITWPVHKKNRATKHINDKISPMVEKRRAKSRDRRIFNCCSRSVTTDKELPNAHHENAK